MDVFEEPINASIGFLLLTVLISLHCYTVEKMFSAANTPFDTLGDRFMLILAKALVALLLLSPVLALLNIVTQVLTNGLYEIRL